MPTPLIANHTKLLWSAICLLLLSGCASTPKIYTNQDSGVPNAGAPDFMSTFDVKAP